MSLTSPELNSPSFSYYGFGSKRAWRMSLAPGQLGQRSRKVAYRKLGRFTGTTSVRADRRGRLETTSCRCLAKGKFRDRLLVLTVSPEASGVS